MTGQAETGRKTYNSEVNDGAEIRENILKNYNAEYNNKFINSIVVRFIVIEHHFLITKRNAL